MILLLVVLCVTVCLSVVPAGDAHPINAIEDAGAAGIVTENIPDGIVLVNVARSDTSAGTSTSTMSDLSSRENPGGRKAGTTDKAKLQAVITLQNALATASLMFAEERAIAKRNGTHVRHGCLQGIVRQVERYFSLPEGSIMKKTVMSRVE